MLSLKLALCETLLEIPQEEPITKTSSEIPLFVTSLIFRAKSSDDSCFP